MDHQGNIYGPKALRLSPSLSSPPKLTPEQRVQLPGMIPYYHTSCQRIDLRSPSVSTEHEREEGHLGWTRYPGSASPTVERIGSIICSHTQCAMPSSSVR